MTNIFIKNGVVLTEHIKPVIEALDPFFVDARITAWITSGLRSPEDQLRIIRNELKRRSISADYPGAFEDATYKKDGVYGWQWGWSKLLSVGFVVNPPYPAVVLMDYFRPGSTENRKGKLIGDSPHTRGTAFDLSGGFNGVTDEAQVIEKAMGKVVGLKGYLIERNQNCVHVDCNPINV